MGVKTGPGVNIGAVEDLSTVDDETISEVGVAVVVGRGSAVVTETVVSAAAADETTSSEVTTALVVEVAAAVVATVVVSAATDALVEVS